MRRNIPQSFQLAPFAWEDTYKLIDRELAILVSQFEYGMLDIRGNDEWVPNAKCKDERNDWRRYLLTMRYSTAADVVGGGTEWLVTRIIPTLEFLRHNGGLDSGTAGVALSGATSIGYNPYNLVNAGIIKPEQDMFAETVQGAMDALGAYIRDTRNANATLRNIVDADCVKESPPFNGTISTARWVDWERKIALPANKVASTPALLCSAIFGAGNEAVSGNYILMGGTGNKAVGLQSSLIIGESNYIYDIEESNEQSDSAYIVMGGTGNLLKTSSCAIVNGACNDIANASNSFITGSGNKIIGNVENVSILGSNNTISRDIRNTVLLGDSLCPFTSNLAAARYLSIQDRVLLLGSLASDTYQAYNSCKGRLLYVDGYTGDVETTEGKRKLPTVAWTGGANGQILYWRNEGGAPMPQYGPPSPNAAQTVYWGAAGMQFGDLPVESGGTGASNAAAARGNLGAAAASHTHSYGEITGTPPSPAIPTGVSQRAKLDSTASGNSLTSSTIGVAGTLPVDNGGTGQTTLVVFKRVLGATNNTLTVLDDASNNGGDNQHINTANLGDPNRRIIRVNAFSATAWKHINFTSNAPSVEQIVRDNWEQHRVATIQINATAGFATSPGFDGMGMIYWHTMGEVASGKTLDETTRSCEKFFPYSPTPYAAGINSIRTFMYLGMFGGRIIMAKLCIS